MVHINQEVSRAVEECVDSAEYKPPSLPTVDGPDWAPLLATPPTDHAAILANQGMCTQGKEVFSFVTFFLMSDNIRGRPAGMLQTIRDSVSSPAILKRVMKKTDPRLLRNGVNNVTDGFYTLLGHFWEIQDLSTMVKWLDHILGPLITAATAAYLKHYEPPRAKQAPKARKNDTESNKAAAHRMSDDILFLTNLRDLQLDSSDSENSSGSDMSVGEVPRVLSPPAIPAFGSWPLSPLNLGALSKSTRGSFAAPSDPHIPSDELYRHWVSLPGPSYIEFELGLPEPEEYRQNERTMAAMQGLLPPLEIEAEIPETIPSISSAFEDKELGTQYERNLAALNEKYGVAGPSNPTKGSAGFGRPVPTTPDKRSGEPRRPLTPINPRSGDDK